MNLARLYDQTIRDYLPRRKNVLQGEVHAKQARLFDLTVDEPNYEQELIDAVVQMTREGDTVVIVGGGWGVSAYFAAKVAETVIVYEGSDTQLRYLKETMAMNDGTDNIDVRAGYVGGVGQLYARGNPVEGSGPDTMHKPISALPGCDLLVLDAEGGECMIVHTMGRRGTTPPKRIVVESHPQYGCDSMDVEAALDTLGYHYARDEHDVGHVYYGERYD